MLNALASVFLVQMDDSFRIAPGAIAVAARFEILPQILMVINFTIEDDPNVSVFIAQGLMAGLNVDDAEPSHGQPNVLLDEEAVIVRTAVDDLLVHCGEQVAIHAPGSLGIENTADSAHDYTLILLGTSPGPVKICCALI
jgi:hypothetical protein